jgi:hypothetical protein
VRAHFPGAIPTWSDVRNRRPRQRRRSRSRLTGRRRLWAALVRRRLALPALLAELVNLRSTRCPARHEKAGTFRDSQLGVAQVANQHNRIGVPMTLPASF